MPGEIVLELADARVAFDGTKALDGMSFAVRQGEIFGLVGPDGAGKTTAIRALLGLVALDGGTARAPGKSELGYLSQRFTLYGDLTVQENVEFFAEIHRVENRAEHRERVLAFSRLAPFRDRRADKLSGGMQKKLALACTLVHTPRVLLLDEPTTGVDPISRREFWQLLFELVAGGLTVLLTTPYLDEAERCTRVALVRAGRVLACDTPVALRAGLGETVLEIIGTPVRRLRDQLAASDRVREVRLFGDRMHVWPRRRDDALRDVVAGLEGVDIALVRAVQPTLEDVFIRSVEEGPR